MRRGCVRGREGAVRATVCSASATQSIPLDLLILADRLEIGLQVIMETAGFSQLHVLARGGEATDDCCGAADGVCFRFRLGLFLLGDGADLVEVAGEYGGVGDVLGGFGELEEGDAGADGEEAHDDGYDLGGGAAEAFEEDGGGDDGGAGEEDVVRRRDQCRVEDIESFLRGGLVLVSHISGGGAYI